MSRRSTTRWATRPAQSACQAAAIRRFVRYLELMRARDGETTEVLDIQVELDAPPDRTAATDDEDDTFETTDSRPTEDGEPDDDDVDDEDDDVATELTIPDDPTVLSYLLSGIVQVELPRRQRLLEAETTEERLAGTGRPARPRDPAAR